MIGPLLIGGGSFIPDYFVSRQGCGGSDLLGPLHIGCGSDQLRLGPLSDRLWAAALYPWLHARRFQPRKDAAGGLWRRRGGLWDSSISTHATVVSDDLHSVLRECWLWDAVVFYVRLIMFGLAKLFF